MQRKLDPIRIFLSPASLERLREDYKLHAIVRTGVEADALAVYARADAGDIVDELQRVGCPVYSAPVGGAEFDYAVDPGDEAPEATRLSYEAFQKHVRGLVLGG